MKKQGLSAVVLAGVMLLGLTGCSANQASAYKKYVTLGEYKNIEYTKTVTPVTDDDVQSDLDSFVEGLAETNEIKDRPVAKDDIVNIDYVGTMDGEEFQGGSNEGFDLTIGAQMFIDGFEDGLIGHEIGEKVSLDLSFPDPYPNNPDFAGKPVNFAVTINSISTKKVPKLTDDLVKDNTDYATIDEYKKSIREKKEEQNEAAAQNKAEADIVAKAVENCTISGYDEKEVKELVDQQFEQFKGYTQTYQCTYEQLLEGFGYTSEDELMEGITTYVKQYLDEKMVIYCIAAEEGIKVTKDEVEASAQADADMYGVKLEEIYEYNGEDYYEYKLLSEKVKTMLKDNAKLVDSTEASKEDADDTKADDAKADESKEEATEAEK